MNISNIVRATLPRRLVNRLLKTREITKLGKVPSIDLLPEDISLLSDLVPDTFFKEPGPDHIWHSVQAQLYDNEITTKAGGVNSGDRRAIVHLIEAYGPSSVLEIGTHIGASTVFFSLSLKAMDSKNSDSRVVTVDIEDVNDRIKQPWKASGASQSPKQMLESLGVAEKVQFVASGSLEFLSSTDDRFDLVFLDGDHSAATVYQEIPLAIRRLNPGGRILMHDYFPDGKPLWSNGVVLPGPWMAVERLRREGYPVKAVPLGELPWPTKLGSRRTSMALLVRDDSDVP